MMIALEGTAGSGKTTLRDRILTLAADTGLPILHLGQFSWLSLSATRTLVVLRTNRARVREDAAIAAATEDLALHTRHNLLPALEHHHVICDRQILSTACLLADHYPRPVEEYVTILADATTAHAAVTVHVTTAPQVCAARVAIRPTPLRSGDGIDALQRQSAHYHRAAHIWQRITGQPLWPVALDHPADTDRTAQQVVAELESRSTA